MITLTTKEKKVLFIAALILAIVFGFDDGQETFNKAFWLQNFIFSFVVALFFLLINVWVTKFVAEKRCTTVEFDFWKLSKKKAESLFPFGILISILVMLLSYGKIFFSGIIAPQCLFDRRKRFDRKFAHATDRELAVICAAGPWVLTTIAIFLVALSAEVPPMLITIPFSLAFCSMLPFPGLQGCRVFFGSPTIFVITMTFIALGFFLSNLLGAGPAFIWAVLIALLVTIVYHLQQFVVN